jgi:hypothetical protein
VINDYLVDAQGPTRPNTAAAIKSLFETSPSLSKVVQKYTKICIYDRMVLALNHHFEDAAACLGLLNSGDSAALTKAINKFINQTDELATAFSSLNPCVLTWQHQKDMWVEHCNYVLEIATLVNSKKYNKANHVTNIYTNQMNHMAEHTAEGLAPGYCCKGHC